MLISAQMVQATDEKKFMNVYVYAHEAAGWPDDPVQAFDLPMSLEVAYEEREAGGNLILSTVDVVYPNATDSAYLYSRFREYVASLPRLSGGPPFVWPLPPFALRLWVQPDLVHEWKQVMMDSLRHILLP